MLGKKILPYILCGVANCLTFNKQSGNFYKS